MIFWYNIKYKKKKKCQEKIVQSASREMAEWIDGLYFYNFLLNGHNSNMPPWFTEIWQKKSAVN